MILNAHPELRGMFDAISIDLGTNLGSIINSKILSNENDMEGNKLWGNSYPLQIRATPNPRSGADL